jgi:Fe/S biogenesis protein NfuA
MGIMDRLFGGKKQNDGAPAAARPDQTAAPERDAPKPREGLPVGMNQEEPILDIKETAREKIRAALATQEPQVATIRVSAPAPGRYSMNLEPEGKPAVDDTVLEYDGFQVFVDPYSLPYVQGATLDYVQTPAGEGFQFDNPNAGPKRPEKKQAPEGPEGDFWREVQGVLDAEINPAVASHGGYIDLMDVQGNTVFIQMGGGCQGCGMANVTLKQGVERILQDRFPQIEEILDVTDHAGGRNPYYAPSTK